ncbi:MAG: MMPL family transporter, partial [Sinobacterium sp.]|nr:MMPL family transporter [Sinobacterium sp.]
INNDGSVTAVLVRMLPYIKDDKAPGTFRLSVTDDGEWAMHRLRNVLRSEQKHFEQPLLLGGSLASTLELSSLTKRDLLLFTVAALLLVCIALFAIFKRMSAVLLPILSLISAVSITLSLMMLGEFPMMVSNSILPSFLLAVCVGDAVHLLQAFYLSLDQGISKQKSVANALRHSSPAMFFTTLTTSLGVLSFAASEISSVSTFGLFAAIGVWLAFINTVFFLPALLMVAPLKARKNKLHRAARDLNLSKAIVSLINEGKGAIIFLSTLCLIVSICFTLQLNFSHDVLKWFPADNPSRVATETIDKRLTGTMQVELLVSDKDGKGVSLEQLAELEQWLARHKGAQIHGIEIKSVVSIIDLIQETNKVLLNTDEYTLPSSQALLSQQLLLLSLDSAERIDSLIVGDMQTVRVSLSTSWDDAIVYTEFLNYLESNFDDSLGTYNLKLDMTGVGVIGNRVFNEMLIPVALSYLLAFILISICMALIVRDFRLGLALILPSILPIFMVLGVMHILHIPLDLFTLLIGSIALGLIVDDSIHFIYTYKREIKKNNDVEQALIITLSTTGRALFATTIVLCAGFMIYTLSMLNNLQSFGLLTTLCIWLAFIADIFVTPAAILLLFKSEK